MLIIALAGCADNESAIRLDKPSDAIDSPIDDIPTQHVALEESWDYQLTLPTSMLDPRSGPLASNRSLPSVKDYLSLERWSCDVLSDSVEVPLGRLDARDIEEWELVEYCWVVNAEDPDIFALPDDPTVLWDGGSFYVPAGFDIESRNFLEAFDAGALMITTSFGLPQEALTHISEMANDPAQAPDSDEFGQRLFVRSDARRMIVNRPRPDMHQAVWTESSVGGTVRLTATSGGPLSALQERLIAIMDSL